jgi:hypothetical protein
MTNVEMYSSTIYDQNKAPCHVEIESWTTWSECCESWKRTYTVRGEISEITPQSLVNQIADTELRSWYCGQRYRFPARVLFVCNNRAVIEQHGGGWGW